MKKTLALMTMMSAFAATPALAQDVPFNATVNSTCSILVTSPGTLTANGDATVLSSTNGGGAPGTADVTANSNLFELTVTDPTDWDTGGSAAVGTTFVSSTDFSTFTNQSAGTDMAVPASTTTATIDLTVTAPASIPNGSYTALVNLICD